MIGHSGAGGGFAASVMFELEAGTGVVLSNSKLIPGSSAKQTRTQANGFPTGTPA